MALPGALNPQPVPNTPPVPQVPTPPQPPVPAQPYQNPLQNLLHIQGQAGLDAKAAQMNSGLRGNVINQLRGADRINQLSLSTQDKAALLQDLVDNGTRSTMAEMILQRAGFKNLNDAVLKLDTESTNHIGGGGAIDRLSFEGEKKGIQKLPRFWREQLTDGVKAGAITLGVTGALMVFMPVSAVAVAGAFVGSRVAKGVASYFARERAMYKAEPGQLSLAERGSADLVHLIQDTRAAAADALSVFNGTAQPQATPDQREMYLNHMFQRITTESHTRAMGNLDEFWGKDKRAKLIEAGASFLGGIAGGALASYADSIHALKDGVWMDGGKVVDAHTPGAHFVKNIDGQAYFQIQQGDVNHAVELGKHGTFGPDAWSQHYHFIADKASPEHVAQLTKMADGISGMSDASYSASVIQQALQHNPQEVTQRLVDVMQNMNLPMFHELGGNPELWKTFLMANAERILITSAALGMGDLFFRDGVKAKGRGADKKSSSQILAGLSTGRFTDPFIPAAPPQSSGGQQSTSTHQPSSGVTSPNATATAGLNPNSLNQPPAPVAAFDLPQTEKDQVRDSIINIIRNGRVSSGVNLPDSRISQLFEQNRTKQPEEVENMAYLKELLAMPATISRDDFLLRFKPTLVYARGVLDELSRQGVPSGAMDRFNAIDTGLKDLEQLMNSAFGDDLKVICELIGEDRAKQLKAKQAAAQAAAQAQQNQNTGSGSGSGGGGKKGNKNAGSNP